MWGGKAYLVNHRHFPSMGTMRTACCPPSSWGFSCTNFQKKVLVSLCTIVIIVLLFPAYYYPNNCMIIFLGPKDIKKNAVVAVFQLSSSNSACLLYNRTDGQSNRAARRIHHFIWRRI